MDVLQGTVLAIQGCHWSYKLLVDRLVKITQTMYPRQDLVKGILIDLYFKTYFYLHVSVFLCECMSCVYGDWWKSEVI